MREATYADPLDLAIKRYEHAAAQLGKVAHYVDREVMGRAASASEMAEFAGRSKHVAAALHALAAAPCADFRMLRRKAKALVVALDAGSLGQRGERALVNSILQMPKATHAE